MHSFRSRATHISQYFLDGRSTRLYVLNLNGDQLRRLDPHSWQMLRGLDQPRYDEKAITSQRTASFLGTFPNEKHAVQGPRRSERGFVKARSDPRPRLRTCASRVEHTSNKPRRSTAINVSSFIDSAGFRIAALVFFNAFPKVVRPSCWSLRLFGELPEIINATDEVANDKGEPALVLAYKGNRCSRWPWVVSGWRGRRTKSRKNAQIACCSGKSLNILGISSLDE